MTIDRVISLSSTAGVEPVVVQQNDRESRTVRFLVYESSGVPLDMQGKTARIFFRKNGATSKAYDAAVAADGWISLTVPQEVTVYPGNGEMQLALVYGSSILHSFTIPFSVKGSLSFMGETETPEDDPMRIAWDTLPGKPDTFPPSAHTHTPAQAGALPAGGTAVNAAKLNGQKPGYYRHAHNYLFNSDLLHPVNCRGKQSYTGSAFSADCWRAYHADTVHTLTVNGLAVSGNPTNLYQMLDETEFDSTKPCTAAVCDGSGNISVWSGIPSETSSTPVCVFLNNGKPTFRATGEKTWVWAAVYPGEYTADTLPAYVPAGYVQEQTACQHRAVSLGGVFRYRAVQITGSIIDFAIPLPATLRARPSFDASALTVYSFPTLTAQTDFSFAIVQETANGIVIRATKAGHGLTDAVLNIAAGTIFSADLT